MMYRPVVAADKDAIEVQARADPNGRQPLIIPSRWTEIRPLSFGIRPITRSAPSRTRARVSLIGKLAALTPAATSLAAC